LGLLATRPLSTGQVLRQDMVKAAQVFSSGAQVRVVARGPGFEIATSAQALSAGVVGPKLRGCAWTTVEWSAEWWWTGKPSD
jgi:flagella basal body P-ring formation protein FlgA